MDLTKEELKAKLEELKPKDTLHKGKSSIIKSRIIEELKSYVTYLEQSLLSTTARIQKLLVDKAVQALEIRSLRTKLERRDAKIDSVPLLIKEEVDQVKSLKSEQLKKSYNRELSRIGKLETQLRKQQKTYEARIAKLEERIRILVKRHQYKNQRKYEINKYVKELKSKIVAIKKQVTIHKRTSKIYAERIKKRDKRIRTLLDRLIYKPRKPKAKVIRIKQELTEKEKEFKRLVEVDFDKRLASLYEVNMKTVTFFKTLDTQFDLNKLNVLIYVSTNNFTFKKHISHITDSVRHVQRLVSEEYLGYNNLKNNSRYYYITDKGKKLLEDYKNYISYGKSNLFLND